MSRIAESLLYSTRGAGLLPETDEQRKARKRREQDAWVESLRLRNDLPPISESDVLNPKGRWRTIVAVEAERIAAAAAEERARQRDMEAPELLIIEDPSL